MTPANNGLYFIHNDHLGSASVMSTNIGASVGGTTARYLPFGDWRTEPTAELTDRGYTSHKHNNRGSDDIGLIYMNARYYVPGIGRFASADTIVPNPANPQSYNRYSYVRNNPLNFVDPTGHVECGLLGEGSDTAGCEEANPTGETDNSAYCEMMPAECLDGDYDIVQQEGTFTMSAYVFADESEFSGDKVGIPGVAGKQAREDFLFGVGGVITQGTGILDDGTSIYITNPGEIYWADDEGNRLVQNEAGKWVRADNDKLAIPTQFYNPEDAIFAEGVGRTGLIPHYSVAAPDRYAFGTLLYIPALAPYTPNGGIFEVQDRGGAIIGNTLDLFVGTGFSNSDAWFDLGGKRLNLTVFVIRPNSCSPICQ